MKKEFTVEIPHNKPHYRDAFIIFALLDSAFLKIDLQKSRIHEETQNGQMGMLFADIHFLLIAISNLKQLLTKLRNLFKNDVDYKIIYKTYIQQLEYLGTFRDHLEHIIDGRIDGKNKKGQPLKNPGMLGNLFNDEYDFGGERFNILKTFDLCSNIYSDLEKWNRKINAYPLWGMAVYK